jgi:hypothetical protein
MDSRADVEVKLSGTAHDRPCTRHRACGTVKAAEEAVARGVDLVPPEARKLASHILVMMGQQISPCPVPERGSSLRGADEVREQNRREDRVGDPIGLCTFDESPGLTRNVPERLDERVGRQRDRPSAGNAASHIQHLLSLRWAVEYEGRHVDASEHVSKIGLA